MGGWRQFMLQNPNICQDRLGTNIGKTQKGTGLLAVASMALRLCLECNGLATLPEQAPQQRRPPPASSREGEEQASATPRSTQP